MALPAEIWSEILRARGYAMRCDLLKDAASLDFRNPAVVARVRAAWREIGSPEIYAHIVADVLERHAAWHAYYA